MPHTLQHLEEQLRSLEDTQRRCVGDAEPQACLVCYTVPDGHGCMCLPDEHEWAPLPIALIELRAVVVSMQQGLRDTFAFAKVLSDTQETRESTRHSTVVPV